MEVKFKQLEDKVKKGGRSMSTAGNPNKIITNPKNEEDLEKERLQNENKKLKEKFKLLSENMSQSHGHRRSVHVEPSSH